MLKKYGYVDDYIDKEIDIALNTTINEAIGRNVCMCHGDLGNLRIIKYAADTLKKYELSNRCNKTFNTLYREFLQKKWDKGVFRGTENYGLMVGLSGFGYNCLQNYYEDGIPEILWLS